MESYTFTDALADARVEIGFPSLSFHVSDRDPVLDAAGAADGGPSVTPTVFFPGCSFLNYALPLVRPVQEMLGEDGRPAPVSLLCCGRILDFEPDGAACRRAFDGELVEAMRVKGVKRIVAGCPNCAEALAATTAAHDATGGIEIAALPAALAERGYRFDLNAVSRMVDTKRRALGLSGFDVANEPDGDPAYLWIHRSCPDRETLEFARGTAALCPEGSVVDVDLRSTGCCGSKVRAAGRFDAAERCAAMTAGRAVESGAQAIVVSCMSCASSLAYAQADIPVIHYLEFLFDRPIDWRSIQPGVAFRFLMGDAPADDACARSFFYLPKAVE